MADEQSNPLPQQAIPPKAVPPTAPRPPDSAPADGESPTVRRQNVPTGSVAPSTAPRTVRLRPVAVPGGVQPAGAPVPAVTPSMAPNAVDAAIKRMTAQIPQPTIETAEGAAQTRPAPAAAPAKKSTSRIPLPTTPISAAVDAPKTIKIQPLAGITPPLAAQPSAPVAPMGESQPPQASKSKTSRIPLEAAMGVSQSSEANAPRTIKLKRPGDMSAVKVAVPGAQAGTPTETDTSAITQRKTIRVKRPTAPTVAEGEGAAAADDAAAAALAAERLAAIQATAPERHGAPFMVAAALCVVVLIGLLLVFAAQIFGPNASLTQLSVWPGIDIPLPGSIQVES